MTAISLQVVPLQGDGREIKFSVNRMFNAAFAGRDSEDVQHHIDEMIELGIPAPNEIPQAVALSNHLLSNTAQLQLYADTTSGEVEYVLFWHQGEILLGVGSDHCDLWLERHSMIRSKNVAPNIIAREVWQLSDVADHFDQLELSCDVFVNGEWLTAQRASCVTLLPPEFWLEKIDNNFPHTDGTVLFSGTINSLQGVQVGDAYRISLADPVTGRRLKHVYYCQAADELDLATK